MFTCCMREPDPRVIRQSWGSHYVCKVCCTTQNILKNYTCRHYLCMECDSNIKKYLKSNKCMYCYYSRK